MGGGGGGVCFGVDEGAEGVAVCGVVEAFLRWFFFSLSWGLIDRGWGMGTTYGHVVARVEPKDLESGFEGRCPRSWKAGADHLEGIACIIILLQLGRFVLWEIEPAGFAESLHVLWCGLVMTLVLQ